MPKEAAYGQYFMSLVDIPVENAERVVGFRVGRQDDKVVGIDLHYEVEGGAPRRLTIPVGHALYMQLLLTLMQRDEKLPFPDDPYDNDWRPPEPLG